MSGPTLTGKRDVSPYRLVGKQGEHTIRLTGDGVALTHFPQGGTQGRLAMMAVRPVHP